MVEVSTKTLKAAKNTLIDERELLVYISFSPSPLFCAFDEKNSQNRTNSLFYLLSLRHGMYGVGFNTTEESARHKIHAINQGYWRDPFLPLFEPFVTPSPTLHRNRRSFKSSQNGIDTVFSPSTFEIDTRLSVDVKPYPVAESGILLSPIMNRGYWLRVTAFRCAIASFFRQIHREPPSSLSPWRNAFLKRRLSEKKSSRDTVAPFAQVVNMGCGFDTTFYYMLSLRKERQERSTGEVSENSSFAELSNETPLPDGTHWVDVDFAEVLSRKRAVLSRNLTLVRLFRKHVVHIASLEKHKRRTSRKDEASCGSRDLSCSGASQTKGGNVPQRRAYKPIFFSDVAADLSDVENLMSKLRCVLHTTIPTLFLFECVLPYLSTPTIPRLLRDLCRSFPKSSILSYDMLHGEDTFGRQMSENFLRFDCPLLSLPAYNNLMALRNRMLEAGWGDVNVYNMKSYAERVFQKYPDQLVFLRQIEILDDVEEWNLLHEHYAITYATNLTELCQVGKKKLKSIKTEGERSDTAPSSPIPWLIRG